MNDYDFLTAEVKSKLDAFRADHVISVYEECIKLADIFSLTEKDKRELLISALLHDITKGLDTKGQLELAKTLGITLKKDNILSPKTLHAVTGAAYAKASYPQIVNDSICKNIRSHTTGRANMSLCEKLLYLADYIEPTRRFEDCKEVRKCFYSLLEKGESPLTSLDSAILFSLDLTIEQLIKDGENIHTDTIKTRNYLISHKTRY